MAVASAGGAAWIRGAEAPALDRGGSPGAPVPVASAASSCDGPGLSIGRLGSVGTVG